MNRIVTLTTDFGTGSGYVAELKGRLLHASTPFTLVDISHEVLPHDVRAAAWLVERSCRAFPDGSLHVVIVDPGVGTKRRLLWARVGRQEFLAPDNGVLSRVIVCGGSSVRSGPERSPLGVFRTVDAPPGASATFHGRDAIAPAAVRLLEGVEPESLGEEVHDPVVLQWPVPRVVAGSIVGQVAHVDRFGNLVTNLPDSLATELGRAGILLVGDRRVDTVVRTYGDASPGTIVALVGSQGFLEVAVVEGRADLVLAAREGTAVTLPAPRWP